MTDKEVYLAALRRRTENLYKLLTLTVAPPAPIVGLQLKLVVLAGMGYAGESLRDFFLEWLDHKVRDDHGLCRYCPRAKERQDRPMCDECWRRIEEEDRDQDVELLMQKQEGGVQ